MKKNDYVTYSGGIRYYDSMHQYDTVRNPAAALENGEDARREYVKMLESFGCDRWHRNHLGVSYAEVEGR